MSLPLAHTDVSSHPSKTGVVDPTNKAEQAADVDRKLRLFGVIQAFRKGRLPTNVQINETLDYVVEHSPVDVSMLSLEGKRLVQDLRDIVETSRLMVQDKNADELLQNLVWHTMQGVDREGGESFRLGDVVGETMGTADTEKSKQEGEQAVRHLRTLLTLVLTNSEVRKLLSDFSLIGRDLLSIGASKAAETLAPDRERLAQVDQPAPENQFMTEGGRVAGSEETPVLEAKIPFTEKRVKQHPHEDTAYLQSEGGERRPVGEVVEEGRQTYGEARGEGHRAGREALGQARGEYEEYSELQEQGRGQEKEEEMKEKKTGFVGKVKQMGENIRGGISERVPQEHKDRANDNIERSKKFFSEEYFPEERRDQFIFRAKKVIIECQKNDDYQDSMRWLLGYVEEYVKKAEATGRSVGGEAESRIPSEKSHPIKLATLELRTLLERFANSTSMDMIFDAVDALIDDAKRDQELGNWFKDVDNWMRKMLLEPGYVLDDNCDAQGTHLRESGRVFYDDKYKMHFDYLFSTIGDWFKAMGDDPLNKRFGDDWARLTNDLLFDSEGGLQFKAELWTDIRKVILPQLIQKVGYLPIPRIEYTDDSLDLVVENLTLQGRNLFPNIVSFDIHNYVKFSPYDSIPDDTHHKISFTLQQIQADMRDVAFYYRKKTGIPKMNDSGLADVLIGGQGVSAHVTLVSTTRDRSSVFHIQDVAVKVENLKFSIRDSKHDFLYKTLRPLATGLIKRQIQKAIKDALTTGLEYVDGQLVGVRNRMEAAKMTEGQSRSEVLKDLFHRPKSKDAESDASVRSGGTASSASTKSGRESQFKIVKDKRESILSEVGHPAGWVNRAEEREAKAGAGEGWKSDAFTIAPSHN